MKTFTPSTEKEIEIIEYYELLLISKQQEFEEFSETSKELESELQNALDAVSFNN